MVRLSPIFSRLPRENDETDSNYACRRHCPGSSGDLHERSAVGAHLHRLHLLPPNYRDSVRPFPSFPVSPSQNSSLNSQRKAIAYHDYIGPTVLCGVLFIAVVVNFSLRIKEGL
jgi:hypothetical protein